MFCIDSSSSIVFLPFKQGDFLEKSYNKFLKFELMDCKTYKNLIGSSTMTCGSSTQIADAISREYHKPIDNSYKQ